MLTHTNEKPFECKFCDFKCALKSSLTKHERRHTEEKVERYKTFKLFRKKIRFVYYREGRIIDCAI